MQKIAIVTYETKYRNAFDSLNREWIEKYFSIEPADEYLLQYPEETVINKGGAILMALVDDIPAGTVGLRKLDDAVYELIKMAVSEEYRGLGIGKLLCEAIIDTAIQLGAQKIVLFSNTSLLPALTLYRKLGFIEVPLGANNDYIRSDIKMELLTGSSARSSGDGELPRQEQNTVL